MTWVDWIFSAVGLAWIGEFLFFRNRGVSVSDPVERGSFYRIFIVLLGTILAAFLLQEMRAEAAAPILRAAGTLLFAAGVFLRLWGILHLKAQFTRHVTVREGDEIVSSGPYRKLRHPLYTGLLFIAIGMPLYFTSPIAAVVGGALMIWALLKRIDYEEKLLVEKFGAEYEHWMKQRARLIPYVY
ncbi:isoprenylcysteine carboxylmethyltransferase family protein [Planococcus sp. FY231025]|uniref:isoprenylcysteine carboxylmethyltransferase family protein n=1 Tax=Planococcus sp. FY231025 TaxID=3455699 RepID=UPI003F8F767F